MGRSIVAVAYDMAPLSDEHILRRPQPTKRQQPARPAWPASTVQTAPRSHIRRSGLSDGIAGHHHHGPGGKDGMKSYPVATITHRTCVGHPPLTASPQLVLL